MKKTSSLQTAPVHRNPGQGGFFNLRVSIGLLSFVAGVFLVLFVTANPSRGGGRGLGARSNGPTASRAPLSGQLAGRTFARMTPKGIMTQSLVAPERAPRHSEVATKIYLKPLPCCGIRLGTLPLAESMTEKRDLRTGVNNRHQQCVGRMDSSECSPRRLPDWR